MYFSVAYFNNNLAKLDCGLDQSPNVSRLYTCYYLKGDNDSKLKENYFKDDLCSLVIVWIGGVCFDV